MAETIQYFENYKDIIFDEEKKEIQNLKDTIKDDKHKENKREEGGDIEKLKKKYPKYAQEIQNGWDKATKEYDNEPELSIDFKAPWAKEFVIFLVVNGESNIVFYSGNGKWGKEPYAKEIFLLIAKVDPEGTLSNNFIYKDEPYAKEIFLAIAKESATYTIDHLEDYSKVPYRTDVVLTANKYREQSREERKGEYGSIIEEYPNKGQIHPYAELILLLGEGRENNEKIEKIINYFDGKTILVGKQKIILIFPNNLNLFAGIIKTYKAHSDFLLDSDENMPTLQYIYEQNIKYFIETGRKRSPENRDNNEIISFKVSNGETSIQSFSSKEEYKDKKQSAFDTQYGIMNSYFNTIGNVTTIQKNSLTGGKPDGHCILGKIKEIIEKANNQGLSKNIMIHIAFNDNAKAGSMREGWSKKECEELFKLTSDTIHLNITSHNANFQKDDIRDASNITFISSLKPIGENGLGINGDSIFEEICKPGSSIKSLIGNGDESVNFNEAILYRNTSMNRSRSRIIQAGISRTVFERINQQGQKEIVEI